MKAETALSLIVVMVPFSLAAVGGGPSIFAPLQHETVDVRHWVTGPDFIDLFAVARAAPGPATMIAELIGWRIGGLLGALIATIAIFLPSSLLCYFVAKVWNAYRGHRWHRALEEGLAPVAAGLIFAGGLAIFQVTNSGLFGLGVAVCALVLLLLRPRSHPFVPLIFGAFVFMATVLAGG